MGSTALRDNVVYIIMVSSSAAQRSVYLTPDRYNKKAVLPQGNRAMLQVFFSVDVRQEHSLQVSD